MLLAAELKQYYTSTPPLPNEVPTVPIGKWNATPSAILRWENEASLARLFAYVMYSFLRGAAGHLWSKFSCSTLI